MMSKDTAAAIRANISDEHTFPVEYYNPHWGPIDNHGTTHLSTVDKDDMAVALTSTVNLLFGSKLLDPKTGVILNDEMDDFSIPGRANAFGLQPSPYNYPAPGKRPLSSCVPTIVEKDGKFEMSLGGSGGSRILTAVLLVCSFFSVFCTTRENTSDEFLVSFPYMCTFSLLIDDATSLQL